MIKVAVIAIGDELLIGQVTDTNSGDIARTIAPAGWTVSEVLTVHDDADAIYEAVDRAMRRADVVLTTGGLGPTKDDITKAVLCRYFGGTLRYDEEVAANVRGIFARRGLEMNELTASQAYVPDTCRVIPNRVGTAPVMWFERDGRILVSMPGVPFEMRKAMTDEVFPRLVERFRDDTVIRHRTLLLTGISESAIATRLDSWESALPRHLHLAYLPQQGYIKLRFDAVGTDAALLEADLDRCVGHIRQEFEPCLFACEDIEPARLVLRLLSARGLSLSTAESCTGGNIAHLITSIAGSSEVFRGGVVAYSNDVKQRVLGVDAATLAAHGAVSEPVVGQMAGGVASVTSSDCAIATSGIAGPGGAVPGKPVGTVCIAVRTPAGTESVTCHFPGDRSRVIDRASTTALIMLVQALEK